MQEFFILESSIEKLRKINKKIKNTDIEQELSIMDKELISIKEKYRELQNKIGRPSLDISSYDVSKLQIAGFTQHEIAFILETGKTSIYNKAVKKENLKNLKGNKKDNCKISVEIEFEGDLFQKKDFNLYILDEDNIEEMHGLSKKNVVLFRQFHMLIKKLLTRKNTVKLKIKSRIIDFSEFNQYAVNKFDLDYKLTIKQNVIAVERTEEFKN